VLAGHQPDSPDPDRRSGGHPRWVMILRDTDPPVVLYSYVTRSPASIGSQGHHDVLTWRVRSATGAYRIVLWVQRHPHVREIRRVPRLDVSTNEIYS
jgi:hypothetical protein